MFRRLSQHMPASEARGGNNASVPPMMGAWGWDIKTDTITWSEQMYRIAGYDPKFAVPSFREHSRFYTSESWDRLTAAVLEVFKAGVPFEIELQMLRSDGATRWIISSGKAVRDSSNGILQLRGTVEDITERKRQDSEAALRTDGNIDHKLTDLLINTHEKEKATVSRQLTDDICQSLSLVAIGIQQLARTFPESMAKDQVKIEALWQQADKTVEKMYRLAQELRPAALDLVGLAAAIRGHCREFSNRSKVSVECSASALVQVDKRVALSLFRICQEALRNVEKHSKAKNVEVELTSDSKDVMLRISDDGVGFEPGEVKGINGLGLIRVKEQLRLIGGELAVWSRPCLGTRLEARAPLTKPSEESDAA